MAQRNRRYSRRRRRGRFSGLYRLFAVLAVLIAVAAACVIFFRVNEVTVEGNSRYTAEEIVAVTGIETGDNLIAMRRGMISSAIRMELPYVESVTVRRRLPDRVEITVTESAAAARVRGNDGKYWLISAQGKLLEQGSTSGVVQVNGLIARDPFAGGAMAVSEEDANTLDYLLELLDALEEKEMLAGCGTLDCSSASCLTLEWDIYTLKLSRDGDYPYLLRLLENALQDERMPKDVPGVFDFTVEEGRLHFRRDG